MNKFTRALSLALAAVTAAGCLAACGSKTKLPDKQTVDHVYRYESTVLATYDEVKWDDDTEFKATRRSRTPRSASTAMSTARQASTRTTTPPRHR